MTDTVPMTIQYDAGVTETDPMKLKALQMYEEEKLTQAEIARHLDVAQSTVSIWISKARQDLRNGQGNLRGIRRRTRDGDLDYRAITRDLSLIVFVICAVIMTIDLTHIAWR